MLCDCWYSGITLWWTGLIYCLCPSQSLSSSLLFLLNSVTTYPCTTFAPSPAPWSYVCYIFWPQLLILPCPLCLLLARQLWIIKWWIRGYFLPTQTCGGWVGSSAADFIPLSSRNATKSQCCPFPLSRKAVESPLILVSVPLEDRRGLDAAGRNSCCNKKQQSTSGDEFLPAANLALCDNNDGGFFLR